MYHINNVLYYTGLVEISDIFHWKVYDPLHRVQNQMCAYQYLLITSDNMILEYIKKL
jgi:hypothetical protein